MAFKDKSLAKQLLNLVLESISCLFFFSWLLFPFFVSSLYFPPWFVSYFFLYFPFFNYIDQIIYSHVMIWTLEMFAHWLSFVMKRWHLLLFFFFNGASVFLASLINFSLIFELMAINSWYFPDQTLFCSVNCMELVHHILFFLPKDEQSFSYVMWAVSITLKA